MLKRKHSEMNAAERVAQLLKDYTVVIFSKSYCPFCVKVKALFDSLHVEYKALELDLIGEDGVAIQQSLFEKTKQKTVPNVFVNGKHVGGCDATIQAHQDGRLAELLSGVQYDYDLIVIGGGSGGLAASKEAASFGKKVAVCDFVVPSPQGTTWGLGGTCVNVGCIPKKLMHKAAIIGEDLKDARSFGWDVPEQVLHNWTDMVNEVQNYVRSLNFGYRKVLKEKTVTYLNAYAQFVDAHTVKVTDKKNNVQHITARDFIIAVGGRPKNPGIPGAKEYSITSDDLFSLKYHPGKCLVVGASYIALECAGFLHAVGIDCTIMVRSILLRGFDQQLAEMIGDHMMGHGVKFIRPCVPTKIEKISDGKPGLYKVSGKMDSGEIVEGEYNTILFAVGRSACTDNIGLDNIGVKLNPSNGKVIVDKEERTSVNNIYAIGDVIDGKLELTPVAIQAGKLLAQLAAAQIAALLPYGHVPFILNDGTLDCNGIAISVFRVIHGLVSCETVQLEELKLTSPTLEHVLNTHARWFTRTYQRT